MTENTAPTMALNHDLDENTVITTTKALADLGADLTLRPDNGSSLVEVVIAQSRPEGSLPFLERIDKQHSGDL